MSVSRTIPLFRQNLVKRTPLTQAYTSKRHHFAQAALNTNMAENSTTSSRLFPPQMEAGLEFKFSKNYCLGTETNKKMFFVSFPKGMFNKKALVKLHSGPNESDPELAVIDYEPGNKKTQIISIPPRADSDRDTEMQAKFTPYIGGWTDITHSFVVPCGSDGKLEEFQWRMNTKDANIKAVGAYGFNLHHVSGNDEVVALVALAKSFTMSKWYTFYFIGEGLTGKFGEDWEIATVAAGIRTYQLEDLRIAGATAASAG